MKKFRQYNAPDLEILYFPVSDIVRASSGADIGGGSVGGDDEDELPVIPIFG